MKYRRRGTMIYTGYFAKVNDYKKANLVTVSIAGKAPDFYNGAQYKALAPTWKIFSRWKKGEIDDMQYTVEFTQQLATLDKEAVRRMLNSFGGDIILLCYEKPGTFCHRHIVADWIESNLGMRVEEYDQLSLDGKARATEALKSMYYSEDDLEEIFSIANPADFLQQLREQPPKGYFLYLTQQVDKYGDNVIQYTLENTDVFLQGYEISSDKVDLTEMY